MLRHLTTTLISSLTTITLAAPTARAQGFAPAEGTLWTKLGYTYTTASSEYLGADDVFFDPSLQPGERGAFRSRYPLDVNEREPQAVVGGQVQIHTIGLNAVYSPVDRLVLGLYASALVLASYENAGVDLWTGQVFNGAGYTTESTGPGDLVLSAGYQLTPRSWGRFGTTTYVHGKIPTALGTTYPFNDEATRTDGQLDLALEQAATFMARENLALTGRLLLRYRFPFTTDTFPGRGAAPAGVERFRSEPGHEVEWGTDAGFGATSWLWLKAGYVGLWALPTTENFPLSPGYQGLEERFRRRAHTAFGSAYVMVGKLVGGGLMPLALDLYGSYVFAGQDVAASLSLGSGLAWAF